MNNKDLHTLIDAFDDFMEYFDSKEVYYEGRKIYENHRSRARKIVEEEIEEKAAKMQVTCDYYIAEFM